MLDVPGAQLYHEVFGDDGPLLLMIPGGLGDAGFYSSVAPTLADCFTVVTYDRRGNSRSTLDSPPQDLRMDEQTGDAIRLLDALGGEPAFVFGGSGGAIVGLDLVAQHPERVRALVAHEPPVVTLLPDRGTYLRLFDDINDIYHSEGAEPAMEKFIASYGGDGPPDLEWDPTLPPDPEIQQRFAGNFEFLLAHEMRPFVRYEPDLDALRAARSSGCRVVLGGGRTGAAHYPYRAGATLADLIGTEFADFPGDHAGYLGRPRAFAERLVEVLDDGTIAAMASSRDNPAPRS